MSCKYTILCILVILLTACGGGGSSSSSSSSDENSSSTSIVHVSDIQADVSRVTEDPALITKVNVSQFAEIAIFDVMDNIGTFEEIRDLYASLVTHTGNVPHFSMENVRRTINCDRSGTVDVVIERNGQEFSESYTNCENLSGEILDGQIAVIFSNLNYSTNSYELKITLVNFEVNGAGYHQKFNGYVEYKAKFNYSGDVQLEIISSREAYELLESIAYDVENFRTAVHYSPYSTYIVDLTLSEAEGSLGLSSEGRVTVDFITNGALFIGDDAATGFLILANDIFNLLFDDAAGDQLAIQFDVNDLPSIDSFFSTNRAPSVTSIDKIVIGETESPYTINFSDYFFDEDMDVLSLQVRAVSEPAIGTFSVVNESFLAGMYQFWAVGEYALEVRGVDPDGESVAVNFILEVERDTDRDGLVNRIDSDDDNDGYNDTIDAFPLDVTEWIDTDSDGQGNNADTDDDNDGAADFSDVAPLDDRCADPSQGTDNRCYADIATEYDDIVADNSGIIYFLVSSRQTVLRLNTNTSAYISPLSLSTLTASNPLEMDYSLISDRLYFGYADGTVTYIERTNIAAGEITLAVLPTSIQGLAVAGNYILCAAGGSVHNAFSAHYLLDGSGAVLDELWPSFPAEDYIWDSASSRIYYISGGYPGDLHYLQIDSTSGLISGDIDSPYHGDYPVSYPVLYSPSGNLIFTGGGLLFSAHDLGYVATPMENIVDGLWDSIDGLILLASAGTNQTEIKYANHHLQVYDHRYLPGAPLKLIKSLGNYYVLTQDSSHVNITLIAVSDDYDLDGIANHLDAFPDDVAASTDTDMDGYPDNWNSGRISLDSTTGLVLDTYPNEFSCHDLAEGDGSQCDYDLLTDNYSPDEVIFDGTTVYLLERDASLIHRWDPTTKSYLAPLRAGVHDDRIIGQGPFDLEVSTSQNRLYLAYQSGRVTYLDLGNLSSGEVLFRPTGPYHNVFLESAGNFLTVGSGIYDENGVLVDTYAGVIAYWNAALNRIFFRTGGSPSDLEYAELDPVTGAVINVGESPYHGEYSMVGQVVPSPLGDRVFVASGGNIFSAVDLTWQATINEWVQFAVWHSNGDIYTLRTSSGTTVLETFSDSGVSLSSSIFSGTALGLFRNDNMLIIITLTNGKPLFSEIVLP